MKITKRFVVACCIVAIGGVGATACAETPFPLMPSVAADPDGTLHLNQRTLPQPAMTSPEAKAKYVEIIDRSLALKPASREEIARNFMQGAGAGLAAIRDAVLKVYPSVEMQETQMGGVKVAIYTPKDMPARNRNRVVMMFNSDPTGVSLAAISKMKVIGVQYVPTVPKGNAEIVAVYRELLKSHKPSQIAMVGLSGGCQFAANTAMWLPEQKLPFPGALGLLTCAGGSFPGDSRNTLNGLDAQLSDYTMAAAMRSGRSAPPPVEPGEPQREVLDTPVIPKGFPPSYLLSGTRDMCLSETALLHRKLRHAGVEVDLNIFEGMWHGFNMEPELPETRDAAADLAGFLDRHMGT
jgi:monoterpene epsilon-lactone hydrolase